jgi:Cu/Ag efflux pump CusA
LATVIIGGLMTSTFLTLVVVPVIYGVLRRERRRPDASEEGEPPAAGMPSEA